MPAPTRNHLIEEAVSAAILAVDSFIAGASLTSLPSPGNRRLCDQQLGHKSASVRVASLFFAWYSVCDRVWDANVLPIGYRGKHGDKRLSAALTSRNLTIHKAITAFGENLGWKGNKGAVRLAEEDGRFADFCSTLAVASPSERKRMAEYLSAKFAETRQLVQPVPPIGADVMTFARAKDLLLRLLSIPSEGHIQQFLVAAVLRTHRNRYGYEIRTHHPHAADKYDETAGDIEELFEGELVRAYEVTVRPDWKNRLPDFKSKMDTYGLRKYIIIAAGVNQDEELAEPAQLIAFLEPCGRDIAVVDIEDLLSVMAAELTAEELRQSINSTYELLCQPRLSGRPDFQQLLREEVGEWLDSANSGAIEGDG